MEILNSNRHYEIGVTQLQTPLGTSKPPPNLVNEYIAEFPTTVSWGTEERNKTKEQERKEKKRDDGNGKKGKREERQVTQSHWAFGYAGGGAGIEGTSIGREEEPEQGCACMLQPVDAGSRD